MQTHATHLIRKLVIVKETPVKLEDSALPGPHPEKFYILEIYRCIMRYIYEAL